MYKGDWPLNKPSPDCSKDSNFNPGLVKNLWTNFDNIGPKAENSIDRLKED